MINNIKDVPIIHGENGITVALFYDLCRMGKLSYLLEHVDWIGKKPAVMLNSESITCHLFPSLGRGQYGMGEPDAVIICLGKFAVFIEVEAEYIERFETTFYKQFARFIAIGKKLESDNKKRFVKQYFFTEDKKRKTRGGYNTRKFIADLLKHKCMSYYLVIARGASNSVDKLRKAIIQKNPDLADVLDTRLGWLSLGSVMRFRCLSQNARKIIQFNLKG